MTLFEVLQVRFPATAFISISHRIAGVVLILALPIFLWLLGNSLASETEFATVQKLLNLQLIKPILLLLAWVLIFHALSGARFLLLDIGIGIEKRVARTSSIVVAVLSVFLTLVVAVIC